MPAPHQSADVKIPDDVQSLLDDMTVLQARIDAMKAGTIKLGDDFPEADARGMPAALKWLDVDELPLVIGLVTRGVFVHCNMTFRFGSEKRGRKKAAAALDAKMGELAQPFITPATNTFNGQNFWATLVRLAKVRAKLAHAEWEKTTWTLADPQPPQSDEAKAL